MTSLFLICLLTAGQVDVAGDARLEIQAGPTTLEVFTHKPATWRDGPLILVFHGVLRNAETYRNHARELGERTGALIAAPHFDLARFSVESYQQGGIKRDGEPAPQEKWTFNLIAPITDEIRRREGRPEMPYYLLGHSGGGQFVARLAGFVDSGAERIVAANPGTHLWPTRNLPYPYGFGGLPDEISDDRALRHYLAQPLTIYLGTADIKIDEHLDQLPGAMEQGTTRRERGRRTYEFARKLARERGWAFRWRIVEAAQVGHDHERMFNAPASSDALFGWTAPHVVGHRGLIRQAPENTLGAFRACLALRVGFELDVRRTRDGVLVCVHDESVDRTTDGQGNVQDLSLDELRSLDAGRWFSAEFSGERVPTLDEVCSLLAAEPEFAATIAIDLKAEDSQVEADVVGMARRHGVLDRLTFIGRTIDTADVRKRLKQADPSARVAQLAQSAAEFDEAAQLVDVDWLYVRFIPERADVLRAQRAGKRVFLAGSLVSGRESKNWRKAVRAGIDAILTDYPLELRDESARSFDAVAPARP